MKARRQSYEGVAVTVPVTVPYERYATRGAHWFLGQALRGEGTVQVGLPGGGRFGMGMAQQDQFTHGTLAP